MIAILNLWQECPITIVVEAIVNLNSTEKFETEPGFEIPGQVRMFLLNLNCNSSRHKL